MSNRPNTAPALAQFLLALVIAAPAAHAFDFDDGFDGGFLDDELWDARGGKPWLVDGGVLSWDGGGDWASGEIVSQANFVLPPGGETTTITWVLAPAEITADNGGDPNATSLRYQLGIISANETADRTEHWDNSTGGTWLDIYNIRAAAPDSVGGEVLYADHTKAPMTGATTLTPVTINDWAWGSETRTFKLELTSEEFRWYDGENLIATSTWAGAGIGTEFDNGYRITTMGINFASGRGVLAVDRVASVTTGSPSLLATFGASRTSVTAGQRVELRWQADPSAALEIDQGVGDVGGRTSEAGAGTVTVLPPDVAAPGTPAPYTITATTADVTESRTTTLSVQPRPELSTNSFLEEFEGASIDPSAWESRGGKPHVVEDGYLKWGEGGGNWERHEINSVATYPLPPAGSTTRVSWVLGPGGITADDGGSSGNNSIRYQIGLFSYHETGPASRESWDNTTGGVWLDIYINNDNPTGVGGGVLWADDRKPAKSQYDWRAAISVGDWDWQTEDHEFSIELTAAGYTWSSGAEVIYAGSWLQDQLDNEFANGFRVLAIGMNYGNDGGRGHTSLQSISLTNAGGGGGAEPFAITSVRGGPADAEITWDSSGGTTYDIDRSAALAPPWERIADAVPGQAGTTSFTDAGAPAGQAFYRVTARGGGGGLAPLFEAGFEPGDDLSGWTATPAGPSGWEAGTPTSGPRAAHTGTGVYATNLTGSYPPGAMAFLRSPVIDLGNRTGAIVEFYHWFDFEYDAVLQFPADAGELQVLDGSGFPLLTAPVQIAGSSGGWYHAAVAVPPDAGDSIQLEFGLFSDGVVQLDGWYLDEVRVR